MGLSWNDRSEDPRLYIGYHAVSEHIRYYPPFRVAIPDFKANYPYITHPFAALITSFFSEELKPVNPARLACLIHAASVRSEPGSNSPIIIYGNIFETFCLKQIVPFLNRNDNLWVIQFSKSKKNTNVFLTCRNRPSSRWSGEQGMIFITTRSTGIFNFFSKNNFLSEISHPVSRSVLFQTRRCIVRI